MNWFRKELAWIPGTTYPTIFLVWIPYNFPCKMNWFRGSWFGIQELQNAKESIFVFLPTEEKFDQMNYELGVCHTLFTKTSPQSNEKSG